LRYSDFDGDYDRFLAAVYEIFERDFKQSRPHYHNRPITYDSRIEEGKEATFWHITSEGETENQRIPDLRRCERIRWPRPIIEHYTDEVIRCWTDIRGNVRRRNERRIVLWFYNEDFVVVLADRGRYVLLWTAYCVSRNHTRRKLMKGYEEYQKRQTPPQ